VREARKATIRASPATADGEDLERGPHPQPADEDSAGDGRKGERRVGADVEGDITAARCSAGMTADDSARSAPRNAAPNPAPPITAPPK
jgi:hypothetical protein